MNYSTLSVLDFGQGANLIVSVHTASSEGTTCTVAITTIKPRVLMDYSWGLHLVKSLLFAVEYR